MRMDRERGIVELLRRCERNWKEPARRDWGKARPVLEAFFRNPGESSLLKELDIPYRSGTYERYWVVTEAVEAGLEDVASAYLRQTIGDAWKEDRSFILAGCLRDAAGANSVRALEYLKASWPVSRAVGPAGRGADVVNCALANGSLEAAKALKTLFGAKMAGRNSYGVPAFMCAVKSGNLDLCRWVAEQPEACLRDRTQPEHETALHWAARSENREMTEWVLEVTGFSPNVMSKDGITPLGEALSNSLRVHVPTVALLLERGGDPNAGLATPFHRFCRSFPENSGPEVLELLLEAGADPNRPNAHGATPMSLFLEYARQAETWQAGFRILMEHGGDPLETDNQGLTAFSRAFCGKYDTFVAAQVLFDLGLPLQETLEGGQPLRSYLKSRTSEAGLALYDEFARRRLAARAVARSGEDDFGPEPAL
jgi:ankyrin repeat protein